MKKTYLFIFILMLLGTVVLSALYYSQEKPEEEKNSALETECKVNDMIFYFHPMCSWCNKVKNEGTIVKIEELGVTVTQINVRVGAIQHQFSGVPTFVIDDKVYSGYRTFDQLKELLGCQ